MSTVQTRILVVDDDPELRELLGQYLSEQGYQTGAFIGAFVLDGRWGLNQGFGVYDDRFDLKK